MKEGFPKRPRKIGGLILIDKETGLPVEVPSEKDYEEYEEVMKIHTVYDRRIKSSFQAYMENLFEKMEEEAIQLVERATLEMKALRSISKGGGLAFVLKYLTVQIPDGSEWALPMSVIISHKARKTGGNLEDVIELFRRKEWYAVDWVRENMTWEDFDGQEVEIKRPPRHFIKLSEADWANGIVDIPETLC